MRRLIRNTSRRGTTMIEMLIAALIMTSIFGAIGMTVLSGTKSYEQGVAKAEVDAQARRLVGMVADEFLNASANSLVPGAAPFSGVAADDGFTEFTYTQMEPVLGGPPALGLPRRIRIVLAAGELDDGIDNNGNGLVDECRLMLTQVVGASPEVGIGAFVREYLQGESGDDVDENGNGLVDERGLCMTFDGTTNTMVIRVTIERLTSQGRLITSTAETSVRLRND